MFLTPGSRVGRQRAYYRAPGAPFPRGLQSKFSEIAVSVSDFGARGNGIDDDAPALNAAINSLPVAGGDVLLLTGKNYLIKSPLTIGNGTSSLQSTKQSVRLIGQTDAANANGPIITWGGGVFGGAMLNILGPIKGCGLRNVYLNAASAASYCLKLVASYVGEFENVTYQNATNRGLLTNSVVSGGTGNPNTQFNYFHNNTFFVPDVANAGAVLLDGNGTNNSSNTGINSFINTDIVLPATATVTEGIRFRDCDTNQFFMLSVVGGGANALPLVYDYTGPAASNQWPAGNNIWCCDPGSPPTVPFTNVGSIPANNIPNYVYGMFEGNGQINPNLANLVPSLPTVVGPSIRLTGQTAAIGTTNITTPFVTGEFRVSFYFAITTVATAGTISAQVNWTDEGGGHSNLIANAIGATAKNTAQGAFLLHNVGTNPISFSTSFAGITGSPQYQLFITIEKLR